MKIFYGLSVIVILCSTAYSNGQSTSTSNKRIENASGNEKSVPANNNNVKAGFHSSFSLGLKKHSLCSNFKNTTTNDNLKENLKLDKNHLAVNLSIGYDKNFGVLILGTDAHVTFNPGSGIEYPQKNSANIATFKSGTEYLGFAKLGVAIGRCQVYGKLGGGFAHAKYDWEGINTNKDKSDYLVAFAWGGGIEYRLSEHVLVHFDVIKNNKSSVDKLDVTAKGSETTDTRVSSYQISLGCGYRF